MHGKRVFRIPWGPLRGPQGKKKSQNGPKNLKIEKRFPFSVLQWYQSFPSGLVGDAQLDNKGLTPLGPPKGLPRA